MKGVSFSLTQCLVAASSLLWISQGSAQREILDCATKFAALDFHHTKFDRYHEFFHDDSVMTMAQVGTYKGADGIREYVGFTEAETSPYFKESSEVDSSFKFQEMEDSLCVALTFHRHDYVLGEATAEPEAHVGVSLMAKIFYNPDKNYIPKVNIFYATPFLELLFGQMLSSSPTFDFLCDDVLSRSCGMDVPNCIEQLAVLPALTNGDYADGNSQACRAIHGSFALSKPGFHCPHTAFDASPDLNGAIKCQSSSKIPVSGLFDEEDLLQYMEWSTTVGINGTIGYTTEPYYRTFQREFVDAMQFIPPVSNGLKALAIPGLPRNIYLSSTPNCPAFQNDTTYWTDFATMELSDTHMDYFDLRRLPGDRVFGPGTCTVTQVGTKGIRKQLKEMPRRLMDGTAYRTNEVDKNRLNPHSFVPGIWSDGYVGLALGAPNEDHSSFRPVFDYLFGDGQPLGDSITENGNKWTYTELVSSARDYLADKDRIDATVDPNMWTLKMLHKVALGTNPTDRQMDNFRKYKDLAVAVAFLEGGSVEEVASMLGVTLEAGLLWKTAIVADYEKILSNSTKVKELLNEDDPTAIKKASWAIFDGILMNGGLSVPHVILHSMASYYSGFSGKDEFEVNDTISLKLLVMEAIRRYPPLSSVPILDARDRHRVLTFIGAAGYDSSAYGDNVTEFRIRGDLQWYHERSVAFAEPALPVDGFPGSARICPGRSLAVAMSAAWMEAIGLDEWHVPPESPIKRIPLSFTNFELVRGSSSALAMSTALGVLKVSFLAIYLIL